MLFLKVKVHPKITLSFSNNNHAEINVKFMRGSRGVGQSVRIPPPAKLNFFKFT